MINIQDPEVAKRLIQLIQLGVQQFAQDADQIIEMIAKPFKEAEAAAQEELAKEPKPSRTKKA